LRDTCLTYNFIFITKLKEFKTGELDLTLYYSYNHFQNWESKYFIKVELMLNQYIHLIDTGT